MYYKKSSAEKATSSAGFEYGTQMSKIREMKTTAANTSGCRGVYWHKKQRKWVARLRFQGRLMTFGSFSDFDDAVKARQRAEEEVYGQFLQMLEAR